MPRTILVMFGQAARVKQPGLARQRSLELGSLYLRVKIVAPE